MRWLTEEAKRRVLDDWERKQIAMPHTGDPGVMGGSGGVDPAMIRACEVLNALPGVVTLQSCEGHHIVAADGGTVVYPGQVWLWLSEDRAARVYERGHLIPPRFEQPRIFWQADGQEVLDLRWSPTLDPMQTCVRIADFLRGQ